MSIIEHKIHKCIHCVYAIFPMYSAAVCSHPESKWLETSQARDAAGPCGPNAKLYQEKAAP